ncbi:hypothetical protein CR513_61404, partial [Mucuna pruriens]
MPLRLPLNPTSSAMATYQYCFRKCALLLPYLDITIVILSFLIPYAAALDFNFQKFLNKEDTLNFEDVYYDKGFLQLTQHMKDSVGRVTYYKPLHLWDKDSRKLTDFTSNFSFIINQPNNCPLPVPPDDGSGIGLNGLALRMGEYMMHKLATILAHVQLKYHLYKLGLIPNYKAESNLLTYYRSKWLYQQLQEFERTKQDVLRRFTHLRQCKTE